MATIVVTLITAIFIFLRPPLVALKPYLPTPMARGQPAPVRTVAPPSDTAANPTLALAHQDQAARAILYQRVAARSLGESSFATAEIACTIKNRLQVSGAPINAVLRAYHARDRLPQPGHLELVRQVFEGELPCPATWWYAISLQDTYHWKPHPEPAFVIRYNQQKQIWIFHH